MNLGKNSSPTVDKKNKKSHYEYDRIPKMRKISNKFHLSDFLTGYKASARSLTLTYKQFSYKNNLSFKFNKR